MIGVGRFIGIGVNRFRAGGFCAEYQVVYDSFTTKPSDEVAAVQDTLASTISDQLDKLDFFHLEGGHTNDNGESFINWANPGTYDMYVSAGAPIFTANQGLKRNSAADFVKNHFILDGDGTKYKQDDACLGVYIYENINENESDIGFDGPTESYIRSRTDTTSLRVRLNDSTTMYSRNDIDNDDARGITIVNRPSENRKAVYKNGVLFIAAVTSETDHATVGYPGGEMNFIGDGIDRGNRGQSAAFGGEGLTEGDIKTISDALRDYFDYVGGYAWDQVDTMIIGDKTLGYVEENSDDCDVSILLNYPVNIIGTGDWSSDSVGHDERMYMYRGFAQTNKFKSAIGNHDIAEGMSSSFISFFNLTKTYYTKKIGDVEYFFYDTQLKLDETGWDDMATAQARSIAETKSSTQGQWLINALANSSAKWKILVYHIPTWASKPDLMNYSPQMAWDWYDYGVDLIINGHMHFYERLLVDTGTGNVPVIIAGTSGADQLAIGDTATGSLVRISSTTDADFASGMFITMAESVSQLSFSLHSVDNSRGIVADKDTLVLTK